jgi:hypothetical protein
MAKRDRQSKKPKALIVRALMPTPVRRAWESLEPVSRRPQDADADWEPRYIFSRDLPLDDPQEMALIVAEMTLLQEQGFPPKQAVVEYDPCDKSRKGKRQKLYVLKAKPGCWRLIFGVDEEQHRVIYLLAVCKKKWSRDAEDCETARKRLSAIRKGDYDLERIDLSDS